MQGYYVYWATLQYFFRGSHREKFSAIKFGKVCPGGIYCGEELHWILIFFDLLSPSLIIFLMSPLICSNKLKNDLIDNLEKKIEKFESQDESPIRVKKSNDWINFKPKMN